MKIPTMILRTLTLIIFLGAFGTGSAQSRWSLEKCINYAQQNSLNVKRSELSIQDAKLVEKLAIQNRYPSLNATAGGGFQFGRRIDPASNDFVTESIGYNSVQLSTNVTIYNGGRIKNTIKQSKVGYQAATAELEQSNQDIALDVAVAFLNILMSEDQLVNAQKQLELSIVQMEQTEKLIRAGARPGADLLDIKAQVAQDEQIVVNRENDVEINYLSLKQLLEFPPDKQFEIQRPEIIIPDDADPESFKLKAVYEKALVRQPGVRAAELRVEESALGIDIAKSDLLPRLSAFAEISSNYSSLAKDLDNIIGITSEQLPADNVLLNGSPGTITFTRDIPEFADKNYFNQISDNLGQGVGLNISIPIYNRGQFKTNIQRAEIQLKNQQLIEEQNKQQLKQDIQRAIADARAAEKRYDAAIKTEEALRTAYANTEKKFKLGASNTLEFTTAKNSLDQASVDTIVARYDYLFRLKVVDYYQGKRIVL